MPVFEDLPNMSEEENQVVEEEVKEVVEEPLTVVTALKQVLKNALYCDALARGLNEAVKALDRREAVLCVLAQSCNEPAYTKLVTALCKEHNIPLIQVADGKSLGEWAGLCKYNNQGKAVQVVKCSCVVAKAWGEETAAYSFIQNVISGNQ